MSKKVGFISLGCAKNRVNSEQMMWLLSNAGYHVSGDTDNADIVVINTCGFIESAKSEAVEVILEIANTVNRNGQDADKIMIVAGCLPQRYKKEIMRELPEIDAVIGTGSFDEIVQVVESADKNKSSKIMRFGDIDSPVSETKRIISTSPIWTYLKIADGCDNRCAYCCIPSIRGKYRSRQIEDILREAQELTARGYRELILIAQDTTSYGADRYGQKRLTNLLRELSKIDMLKWIRLMYMYPDGFDDELIDEISNNDKIVKYLDIPIQHINDKILSDMNRRGTSAEIRSLITTLRERIPGLVLRTSIITGLPGEGEAEFKQLCDFLIETKFERAGVFAYSPEEGTPAAQMKYPSHSTAEERAEILQDIQARIMNEYSLGRINTTQEVLIEGYDSGAADGTMLARSYAEAPEADGYIRINRKINRGKAHNFAFVKIKSVENGQPVGEIIK